MREKEKYKTTTADVILLFHNANDTLQNPQFQLRSFIISFFFFAFSYILIYSLLIIRYSTMKHKSNKTYFSLQLDKFFLQSRENL